MERAITNPSLSKDESDLQNLYFAFAQKRTLEYIEKNLTGRIIIDIQKGFINSVLDQQIVAGVSALAFGFEKLGL